MSKEGQTSYAGKDYWAGVNHNDYADYVQYSELEPTNLKIQIGDLFVQKITDMNLTNSLTQFIDTITVTMFNPRNEIGKKVRLGDVIKVWHKMSQYGTETLVFDGVYEKEGGSTREQKLIVSGRSKILTFCEDEMPPKQYKSTTDNAIILDALSGWSGTFDLDAAVPVKEEQSSAGARRAQFAESVAKRTGFQLYCIGDVIYKKKIAKTGVGQYDLIECSDETLNNVLDVSVDINIEGARKTVKGYNDAMSGRKQAKVSQTIETDLEIKTFADKYSVTRNMSVSVNLPAKSASEAQLTLEKTKAAAEPMENVTIEIMRWHAIPLNDVSVSLRSDYWQIESKFIPIDRQFVLDSSGIMNTKIKCIPQGRSLP